METILRVHETGVTECIIEKSNPESEFLHKSFTKGCQQHEDVTKICTRSIYD